MTSFTGQIRTYERKTKSDLLDSLEGLSESQSESPAVDVKVLDGAVVIHMLTPGTSATFQDYVSDVVIPYLMTQLQWAQCLDLVWDIYKDDSLKAETWETWGTGTRIHVMPSVHIPGNWQSFLRNNENKTELFALIATTVADEQVDQKQIHSTYGDCVLSSDDNLDRSLIKPCTQEEADGRIVLHIKHAVQCGHRHIMVRTSDTDVVVLLVSEMKNIRADEIWIPFGIGKKFKYISVHGIAHQLGPRKSKALGIFHAFTGCDVTSFLAGKGK